MADPFSITASAIGTAAVAFQSISSLLTDIQAIKNAPGIISSLQNDIAAVQATLHTLILESNELTLRILDPETQSALSLSTEACGNACEIFRAKIGKWTKHSVDGKMRLWDQAKIGVFAKGDVEILTKRLEACKNTVNAAVSTATLLVTARSSQTTDGIMSRLMGQESQLAHSLRETDEETAQLERRLTELSLQPSGIHDDTSTSVVGALQERSMGLQSEQKVLEGLISDLRQAKASQRQQNIHVEDGGRLLVGMINVSKPSGEISQDINNISAVRGGRGIIGVADNVNITDYFH
ncbi:hypothetical protein BDV28DRAFT_147150 [Aspergillus coremiiformis]|uniref:Azaphilone pigments biosynthesis cluster protein L N-terminal domain-containing protein n=1 Tax=Aspergillus coremiiformis TaxID=138285 RepID=A0A5N6ZCE2_9EURO|nr:hypothetical protein BDV28DRAFT_147150 [Aspergillus coremiiformis]